MKKILLAVFMFVICCVLFGINKFNHAAAQKLDTIAAAPRDAESDRQLAQYLHQITNRSSDGLTLKKFKRGGYQIDLQGRFQNVMLARLEPEGDLTNACVASLEEANAFFGRDLLTGEAREQTQYPKENLEKVAAQHGMSVDEYIFYKNLVARFEQQPLTPQSANISIVNIDGAGEGFNDPAVAPSPGEGGNSAATIGAARLAVFNQAATIWGSFLDSNVTTQVSAKFDPQTCTPTSAVLGSAGTTSAYRDFSGAPQASTWYHYALANKLLRFDADAGTAEINATFNSNLNGSAGCLGGRRFYYGFDNATPAGTTNLLVVVLHEIGHGLGFSSLVNSSTGALFVGFPDAYLRNMVDKTSGLNWAAMSDVQRQASAVNTHNVLWDGASVKMASGFLTAGRDTTNGRVQLFTPNPIQGGSSVSHWDTDATTNLLMEPAINTGLPIDLDLTRQQMRDIGWYRDTNTADAVKDAISTVTPSSGSVPTSTNRTITWTNVGGFNKNVSIELSTDGGVTYPTTIASNIPNTGSFVWSVPNTPTTTARIRVHEYNFADPIAASSANFSIASPTAARVSVAGRVVNAQGSAVSRALVTLTDTGGNRRSFTTGTFGYFHFDQLEAGQTFVISVFAKNYQFTPQVLSVNEDITDLIFTPSF